MFSLDENEPSTRDNGGPSVCSGEFHGGRRNRI